MKEKLIYMHHTHDEVMYSQDERPGPDWFSFSFLGHSQDYTVGSAHNQSKPPSWFG